ncbi:MFS transporter [Streptomyces sp. DH10]|uniref:MFS transporter n=1 Tax=Streptomyces sp. DH10 TaxID=3040121 RepID=UPI00244276EB|nr:MFS transporter [Streptomyces sp. DH10]MDG9709469.1 MFS transporter [Streptomyces sp. DH10]
MTVPTTTSSPPAEGDSTHTTPGLRRALLTSSVGSALEYYDFAIYGIASALVFKHLFFPGLGEAVGLVAIFATYAVGFVARPLGGLFFGSLGDRHGRKTVLVVTVALMGGSSFAIGLLPTYHTAGIWSPILLMLLRLLQGFGAGAEQAGASTLMAEYAPPHRRGYYAALPFVGIQVGMLLATALFIPLAQLDEDVLFGWVWRVPFLLSAVLILVAVYIRLKLEESPAFAQLEETGEVSQRPLRDLMVKSRRNLFITFGLRMAENGTSYLYSTFSISYVTAVVGVSSSVGPLAVACASLAGIVTIPLFGMLSDRIGRVPLYRWAALFQALFAIPAFALMSTGNTVLICVVITVGIGVGVNGMLGSQCALLAELFGARHRYTGVAIGREFSAIIAGGMAPLLGAALLLAFNDSWWPLAGYVILLSLITFLTTFATPETRGRDLTDPADAR